MPSSSATTISGPLSCALENPEESTPDENDAKEQPHHPTQQDDLDEGLQNLSLTDEPPPQPLSPDLTHVTAAWKWYRSLKSPKFWLAPLVGLSDKSFRILCRRHGADMCHTEMTDPGGFHRRDYYRTQMMGIQVKNDQNVDKPLILQLGSSNIPKLQAAIEMAVNLKDVDGNPMIDAVELNCGCPQRCAKKGCYGSFLLDPPRQDILLNIIRTIRTRGVLPTSMPLLVKMRVLHGIPETVDLAKRIVEAGAGLLTIHGRTRYQGGGSKTVGRDQQNLASWPHIAAIKEAVPVPVIANGNVPNKAALWEIFEATGCDGVMSGVGILRDPTLFEESNDDAISLQEDENDDSEEKKESTDTLHDDVTWNRTIDVACEYIDLAILYRTHPIRVSKHLLWMLDGKGFKIRASVARQHTLDLKFVKPSNGDSGGGSNEETNNHENRHEGSRHQPDDDEQGLSINQPDRVATILTRLRDELKASMVPDVNDIAQGGWL